jgi:hypothetical protein
MLSLKKKSKLFFIVLSWIGVAYAQEEQIPFRDPCGFPDTTSVFYRMQAAGNWGYGYDSLKNDLTKWALSPLVRIDSVGATVQDRTMYMLTIQNTTLPPTPRKRIWIHARTHPNEVQGTWVTNEMIKILLGETSLGRKLRDSCIFNIMPMYNPDGVELGKSRENANNIDIESNWNTIPAQPEVQALRNVFSGLMALPNPIQVALNMHSSIDCSRYFVYHDPTGTSTTYAGKQQKFINGVRGYFPNGFQPYNYFVSWIGSASRVYPESWFWYNHGEKVLALTYEDMNCSANGMYENTAQAILSGLFDYLFIPSSGLPGERLERQPYAFKLMNNYPNPFNPTTTIAFSLPSQSVATLKIFDVIGRECATLVSEPLSAGMHTIRWDAGMLSSGMYYCRLQAGDNVETKKIILMK